MNSRFYFLVLFVSLSCMFSGIVHAQSQARIPGDFPDPSVISANGTYYAVGTSSEWAPHLPIFSSVDLKEWKQVGFVFSETPEWVASSFWAPEYFYHNGLYYMYYSAKRKSDGVSCIGVATSKFPDRDFVDRGVVVAYGTESIDAYVVQEGNDLFMTWKAYGLDKRPIELIGSKLSNDGMRLEGEPFSLLLDTARIGIEGQSFIKKDGYYYMFYSAGACCGPGCDYHVQAVRSKTFKGPYEDVGEAVLLGNNEDWKCMGHGTFVKDKQGDYYYVFHGYSQKDHVYTGREGLLAKLVWSDQGQPVFEFVPKEKPKNSNGLVLDFRSVKKAEVFAQWDFRYSKPIWSINKYGLQLSGETSTENKIGNVLTWKPEEKAFQIQTQLDLQKSTKSMLKGLVIYGDLNKAIGVGVKGDSLLVWQANEQGFRVLSKERLEANLETLGLKMETHEDLSCRVYYQVKKGAWKEVSITEPFGIKDLAPWDRSPRPGIHSQAKADETAVFQDFALRY